MRWSFDLTALSFSITWSVFSIFIMDMYAASKLGVTPVSLPILFTFIAIIGSLITIYWSYNGKIKLFFLIVSICMYIATIIFQMKSLSEIMYVS